MKGTRVESSVGRQGVVNHVYSNGYILVEWDDERGFGFVLDPREDDVKPVQPKQRMGAPND